MSETTGAVKKALITGGNGNLGRLVANQLLQKGIEVIKFDIPGTMPEQVAEGEHIVIGDIRDEALLRETISQHKPDTIFHLASLLSGSSEADINAAWDINATSSFKLMQLAMEFNVPRFFFASTIASYGDVDEAPMTQDYPQWPGNIYGVTKIAVERLGVYFKLKHGLDFRCLRFPLVISPFAPKTAVTAFPSHALRAAFNGEPFVFPVSAQTGMSTIFLDDVVDSIVQFNCADREKLTRHAYSLHAYYLSAGMVIDEAKKRFPAFQYGYDIDHNVETLIQSWPDCVDDGVAYDDWGWRPSYDFKQSVSQILRMF